MYTPDEAANLSFEELRKTVLLELAGRELREDRQQGYTHLEVVSQDVVEYETGHPDGRIAYLNVYGWIWIQRSAKPSPDSPWVRRRELTREMVTRQVLSKTQDPEDLNPDEIEKIRRKIKEM